MVLRNATDRQEAIKMMQSFLTADGKVERKRLLNADLGRFSIEELLVTSVHRSSRELSEMRTEAAEAKRKEDFMRQAVQDKRRELVNIQITLALMDKEIAELRERARFWDDMVIEESHTLLIQKCTEEMRFNVFSTFLCGEKSTNPVITQAEREEIGKVVKTSSSDPHLLQRQLEAEKRGRLIRSRSAAQMTLTSDYGPLLSLEFLGKYQGHRPHINHDLPFSHDLELEDKDFSEFIKNILLGNKSTEDESETFPWDLSGDILGFGDRCISPAPPPSPITERTQCAHTDTPTDTMRAPSPVPITEPHTDTTLTPSPVPITEPHTDTMRTPSAAPITEPYTDTMRTPSPVPITEPHTDTTRTPSPIPITEPHTDTTRTPSPVHITEPHTDTMRTPSAAPITEPYTDTMRTPSPVPITEPHTDTVHTPSPVPITEQHTDTMHSPSPVPITGPHTDTMRTPSPPTKEDVVPSYNNDEALPFVVDDRVNRIILESLGSTPRLYGQNRCGAPKEASCTKAVTVEKEAGENKVDSLFPKSIKARSEYGNLSKPPFSSENKTCTEYRLMDPNTKLPISLATSGEKIPISEGVFGSSDTNHTIYCPPKNIHVNDEVASGVFTRSQSNDEVGSEVFTRSQSNEEVGTDVFSRFHVNDEVGSDVFSRSHVNDEVGSGVFTPDVTSAGKSTSSGYSSESHSADRISRECSSQSPEIGQGMNSPTKRGENIVMKDTSFEESKFEENAAASYETFSVIEHSVVENEICKLRIYESMSEEERLKKAEKSFSVLFLSDSTNSGSTINSGSDESVKVSTTRVVYVPSCVEPSCSGPFDAEPYQAVISSSSDSFQTGYGTLSEHFEVEGGARLTGKAAEKQRATIAAEARNRIRRKEANTSNISKFTEEEFKNLEAEKPKEGRRHKENQNSNIISGGKNTGKNTFPFDSDLSDRNEVSGEGHSEAVNARKNKNENSKRKIHKHAENDNKPMKIRKRRECKGFRQSPLYCESPAKNTSDQESHRQTPESQKRGRNEHVGERGRGVCLPNIFERRENDMSAKDSHKLASCPPKTESKGSFLPSINKK